MILTVADLSTNEYFEKRRALANGIVRSGASIGYFISAPVLTYIVENYGIKAGFLAEGFVTLLCVLMGLTLKTPKGYTESEVDGTSDSEGKKGVIKQFVSNMLDKEVLSNKGFLMFALGCVFNFFPLIVPHMYIPSVMIEFDATASEASVAIMVIGILNLFGRLGCGILDKYPRSGLAHN